MPLTDPSLVALPKSLDRGMCPFAPGSDATAALPLPKESAMRRLVAHRLSSETGQTMAEYGVVATVVALTVLVSLSLLAGGLSALVAAVAAVVQ
jgi:Flp pilus assembly pilin Flp